QVARIEGNSKSHGELAAGTVLRQPRDFRGLEVRLFLQTTGEQHQIPQRHSVTIGKSARLPHGAGDGDVPRWAELRHREDPNLIVLVEGNVADDDPSRISQGGPQ